jgi:hypothetical protein
LFTKFPHEFWDLLDSQSEIVVLLRILKNIGFAEDGVCFESRESMCRACHLHKDTWTKVVASLEDKEIIVTEKVSNHPYRITLHEKYARPKIRPRNRHNIYRDAKTVLAKERGKDDNHSQKHTDREPFQVVKRRIEAFQDARNAVPSTRGPAEPDDE